jgi:putative ABC transport system permease protein
MRMPAARRGPLSRLPRGLLHRGPGLTLALIATLVVGIGLGAPLMELSRGALLQVDAYADPLLGSDAETSGWLTGWSERVTTSSQVQQESLRTLLRVLTGLTALLVGIALLNLVALLLARAAARRNEMVMRAVLGASGGTLLRQLAREAGLLIVPGIVGGLLLGIGVAVALGTSWPNASPPWGDGGASLVAAAATLGAFVTITVVAWISPARVGWRGDLRRDLATGHRATGGPGEALLRNALAVGQLAGSLVLLTTAGLLLRGFVVTSATGGNPLADPRDTLTVQLRLPATLETDAHGRSLLFAEMLGRISTIPGAIDTSIATLGASVGIGTVDRVHGLTGNPAAPGRERPASYQAVSPDFFRTHGVEVLRGREFQPGDDPGGLPVAVVNETFVTHFRLVGGGVGRQVQLHGLGIARPWYTIVGVVDDPSAGGIGAGSEPVARLYLSALQHPPAVAEIAVRTTGDPLTLLGPVRDAVGETVPGAVLSAALTRHEYLERFRAPLRWFAAAFAAIAIASLLLATSGLHAVMSFNVSRRRREIGVRMALGARIRDVTRMILLGGLRVTLLGTVLGLLGAVGLARLLQLLVAGIEPLDPALFLALALLMATVALTASYRPARRAAAVEPQISLRAE